MHNVWLIIKREYLEKVRTKSFVISTLAMPLIIAVFVLPGKLATMRSGSTHHIIVVTADQELGNNIRAELQKPIKKNTSSELGEENASQLAGRYVVDVSTDLSDAERARLRERIEKKDIDGYLWLGKDELTNHQAVYARRETGDFMDQSAVRSAISKALVSSELARRGISSGDMANLLRDVKLDVVQVNPGGKEKKVSAGTAFFAVFALMLLLYMTLLLYGIAVMRAVIEEKSSRIIEVLLSSITPKELLAGKVLGVGAAGMTQIAIWGLMVAAVGAPGAIAADVIRKSQITPGMIIAFGGFFFLGYLLYATMYAALGAVVNTEQEGQQMQIIIMAPLIVAISLLMMIIREPSGTAAVWLSMVPFISPLIMYLRIVVQTPPAWQIALSLALLIGTIYGLIVLCSRIYRVGILMYGKRPNLPEILKWIKYAGT